MRLLHIVNGWIKAVTDVGIGTDSPSTVLHVKGSITVETPAGYAAQRKDVIRLRDAAQDRVVIEKVDDLNNGNFGLIVSPGSTTTDVQTAINLWTKNVDVTSDYYLAGSKLLVTGEYNIFTIPGGAYNASPITFSIDSAEKMRIHSDGNVGIGTTSPTSKLEVVGDIYADDEIEAYSGRDLLRYNLMMGN